MVGTSSTPVAAEPSSAYVGHPAPRRWRARRPSIGLLAGGVTSVVGTLAVLAAWEVLSRIGALPGEIPPVTTLVEYLWGELGHAATWSALAETLTSWAVGFAVAATVGIGLGMLIGMSRVVYDLTTVVVEFLRPIPPVVYLPLILLTMGATRSATVVLVLTGAVWPLLVQAAYGVRSVDSVLRSVEAAYGLRPLQRLRAVVLPSAASHIATGLRLTATIALVVTVMTEMLGTGVGLGGILTQAQLSGNFTQLFGFVLLTGALGVLIDLLLLRVEARVLRWHPGYRREG